MRPVTTAAASGGEGGGTFRTSGARFVHGFMLLMLALGIGSFVGTRADGGDRDNLPELYRRDDNGGGRPQRHRSCVQRDFPLDEVEVVGSMSLSLFLAMALAGLQLWLLVGLAVPLVATLAVRRWR